MAFSIYQASVPVFLRGLDRLAVFLTKGEEFAAAQGIALSELAEARLAPDMYPLIRQIQSASDAAKGGGARLAGIAPPSMPDTETTFPELQARVAKTVDFLNSLLPAQFEGAETRRVVVPTRVKELEFSGADYLLGFAIPNFYFHVTTAYGILRHKGVPLGKMDFLGTR
ncbi:DUF1993 family protein [Ferrovibrio sp.]|uniref:DUF1993 domain-containing protein n=1 Tax=Ferrovibrio sp. TaxID=1917215 RepID=UPI001B541CA0|nr:DUF1993 domain-containing protein [Ferrovibrio sp.]MBP7065803.1 DUF1993 domain-containing protein [Ferrovibrio sp.]